MINLIKNEIIKIFSKLTVYIILIITLIFMILSEVMELYFEKSYNNYDYYNESEEYINSIKEEMSRLDKNKEEEYQEYVMYQTNLEEIELKSKYEKDSWQEYVINSYGYEIIENKNYYSNNIDSEEYKEAKKDYDNFIKKLNSNAWRDFAQMELDEINNSLKMQNSKKEVNYELEDRKKVLDWRLQKNIPFGNNELNNALESWASSRESLRGIEESEKSVKLVYSQKVEKNNLEANIKMFEYYIENDNTIDYEKSKIDDGNGNYIIVSKTDKKLIDYASSTSFFIVVIIVVLAGTIVSEEFNKGTIKLLLVKPHKRGKILASKFIACILVLIAVLIILFVLQYLLSGIFSGFSNYQGEAYIYNFKTKAIEKIGVLKYTIINTISIVPQYLLLMVFALTVSIIFNNSIMGVALPLLGYMGADIINSIAVYYEKAKFLKFFVTPNWDLRVYLFGKMPEFEPISFAFSVVICVLYFVVLYGISYIVFNKKDIKNI